MSSDRSQILSRIANLNTYRRGERRAPHKPLLLLIALSRFLKGEKRLSYGSIEDALLPLLKAYAPPVQRRHQPELPYWHLQSDQVWEVENAGELNRQASGFPTIAALRESHAGIAPDVADQLRKNTSLIPEIVELLLSEHFPPSVHEDLLAAVGLDLDSAASNVADEDSPLQKRRVRDPTFRENVLRAYEHRCAVTGFRAAISGSYFGCEAAHVQWHAYDGPDTVDNGISLEPTIHKLFDAGAWTLTDDRRILVSKHFTGSDSAIARLREQHGKPLLNPLSGEPLVAEKFIRWHREPNFGGVFREPALQL